MKYMLPIILIILGIAMILYGISSPGIISKLMGISGVVITIIGIKNSYRYRKEISVPDKKEDNSYFYYAILSFVFSPIFISLPLWGVIHSFNNPETFGLGVLNLAFFGIIIGIIGTLLGLFSGIKIYQTKQRGIWIAILSSASGFVASLYLYSLLYL